MRTKRRPTHSADVGCHRLPVPPPSPLAGSARAAGADHGSAGARGLGRVQTGPDGGSEGHQDPVREHGFFQHAGDGGVVPFQGPKHGIRK